MTNSQIFTLIESVEISIPNFSNNRDKHARYKPAYGEIESHVIFKELIQLYWDIGRMIVDKQQRLGWGKSVVEQLSRDIQKEYPGIKGFSVRNLWNMRLFYSELQQNEKLQPLVAEISWTKNIWHYCLQK